MKLTVVLIFVMMILFSVYIFKKGDLNTKEKERSSCRSCKAKNYCKGNECDKVN